MEDSISHIVLCLLVVAKGFYNQPCLLGLVSFHKDTISSASCWDNTGSLKKAMDYRLKIMINISHNSSLYHGIASSLFLYHDVYLSVV